MEIKLNGPMNFVTQPQPLRFLPAQVPQPELPSTPRVKPKVVPFIVPNVNVSESKKSISQPTTPAACERRDDYACTTGVPRGLATKTELAGKMAISQALLSKFEAGLSNTTEEMQLRLSTVLDYPPQFFTLNDSVYGPGLSEFFHRRRQDTPMKVINRIHAQINVVRMHISLTSRGIAGIENSSFGH